MFSILAIVVGLVIVGFAVVAIAVALALGPHSHYRATGERANTDVIWIVVGLTIIVLVCCLGLVAALMGAIFFFGLPVSSLGRLLGWP